MNTTIQSPTLAIAELASGISLQGLPEHVTDRAKDLLLDHLGASLYGACMPWSHKVREVVLADQGSPKSTVYGSKRIAPGAAALANGTAAHAIEIDDTHEESLSHPGCVVIPAALAMSEVLRSSGADFIAAMVAGYEAQCRVSAALGNALQIRGWHPTSACGVFGAAAAVGNLRRLDASTMASAFGLSASMASGVIQFTQDAVGTMVKRLHAGLPSERGLLAANLAAHGFAGPAQAIEGQFGFARVFVGEVGLERMTYLIGERFEIEQVTVKVYPCCKLFHSLFEAIAECRKQRPFESQEVAAIEPFGPERMVDQTHMERQPQSTMSAQYSLPYCCAAAIALDPTDPVSFSESRFGDAEVLRIAKLVEPSIDQALDSVFPRHFGGGVRIRLRDGTVLSSTVLDSHNPTRRDEIQRKFRKLTSNFLSRRRQESIIEATANLDRLESMSELTKLLRNLELPVL